MCNDSYYDLLIRPKAEEDHEKHCQDHREVQGQGLREGTEGDADHL